MPTYRIIIPVQIIMRYDAPHLEAAMAEAKRDVANQTVGDFLNSAYDLFVTEPTPDGDDGAPDEHCPECDAAYVAEEKAAAETARDEIAAAHAKITAERAAARAMLDALKAQVAADRAATTGYSHWQPLENKAKALISAAILAVDPNWEPDQ